MKRGLHLEKTKRGYDVLDSRFKCFGEIRQVTRNGRKQWVFARLDEYTPSMLEQIAKLVRGLAGKEGE